MKQLIITLLLVLAMACQTSANFIRTHDTYTVVSAMLSETYVAAFLSLIILIAALI